MVGEWKTYTRSIINIEERAELHSENVWTILDKVQGALSSRIEEYEEIECSQK